MTYNGSVMDEADIRFLVGDQGKGKSNTGVAYAVDDYFAHAVAVFPDGGKYPIVATFPHYCCRMGDGKVLRLPKDYGGKGYRIESPIKIFANFHLYGVKYVYCDLPLMVKNMNSPLITDAWFLIDESFMTDKRYSMSQVGKIVAQFGATIRKRRLHFLLMMQYKSMGELRFRAFATQTVLCEYDKVTHNITLTISRKGDKKKQSVTYYTPQYWRYYDTNELIPIPEHVLVKAKELVGVE